MKQVEPDSQFGNDLIASLREGMDILAGKQAPSRFHPAPTKLDVRAIRGSLGLTQAAFGRRFGFSNASLREWEQGRRQPEGAERLLLLVIANKPEVIDEVLAATVPRAAK